MRDTPACGILGPPRRHFTLVTGQAIMGLRCSGPGRSPCPNRNPRTTGPDRLVLKPRRRVIPDWEYRTAYVEQFQVRVPSALHDRLREWAEQEGKLPRDLVVEILEEGVRGREGSQVIEPAKTSSSLVQRECVAVLGELLTLSPDVRIGQLMAHIGFLGEAHLGKGLGYIDDDELLPILYRHRTELAARSQGPRSETFHDPGNSS